jgi:hypothetical protein
MKYIVFLAIVLCAENASANDTSYFAVLKTSLALADQEYTIPAYQNLANTCERIMAIKENEWLPFYYCAYAHLAYMTTDEERKDALLDRAQAYVDIALTINPGESEIPLVVALICYGRMEINPMLRAPTYFPQANNALEKARALNPENPRIYYLKGKSTLYKPEFLGGGIVAALPILEKALQCYREFKAPFDIYPHWGEEESILLYEECKGRIEQE